jgi:hypothetical protein
MVPRRRFLAFAMCSMSSAQPQERRIVLHITVTDRYAKYVTGLRSTDFRVYEDGILQKITSFEEVNSEKRMSNYTITYIPDPVNENEGFRRIRIDVIPDESGQWRVRHMPGYRPER